MGSPKPSLHFALPFHFRLSERVKYPLSMQRTLRSVLRLPLPTLKGVFNRPIIP